MKLHTYLACFLAPVATAHAAVDFNTQIKPILEFNCVGCHSPVATDYVKGRTDLNLESRESALESDKALVPGNPEKSKIYTSTVLPDGAKKLMPPPKDSDEPVRLSKTETELLKSWIQEGAKWPADMKLVSRKKVVADKVDEDTLARQIHERISKSPAVSKEEMKAYSMTLPGSGVVYSMVPIPGGKFKMGSPESEPGRKTDEGPVHEVAIEPFWMGKCEVTWDEYELFMMPRQERWLRKSHPLPQDLNQITDAITRPSSPYTDMSFGMGKQGFPATSMTQHAANKYCQWLSAKTGQFYRLPTEAEWEYACRAGTDSA